MNASNIFVGIMCLIALGGGFLAWWTDNRGPSGTDETDIDNTAESEKEGTAKLDKETTKHTK